MIHIVGLYKCGTSWLLHMLGAHPDVVAWREFDPIAASCHRSRSKIRLALRAKDSLLRKPDDIRWIESLEDARARTVEETFKEMFLGRGWLPVMGTDAQTSIAALDPSNLDSILDTILEIYQRKFRHDDAARIRPENHSKTLGHMHFSRSDLLKLMRDVRDANSSDDVPGIFYKALQTQVEPGARIACKAADQLMHLGRLNKADPSAKCIAVIRDGRDATISARHYESLMRSKQAPWRVAQTSATQRMLTWGVRAAKLAGHARRGEVTVVRYEDLQANFEQTCAALFSHLGLRHSPTLLNDIRELTHFSNVTGGRKPGEAASDIVRRGMVGEWRQVMSANEQRLAWRLLGNELKSFGYSHDGVLTESSLTLG